MVFLKELFEFLWVKCNDIVLLCFISSVCYFVGFLIGYIVLFGGLIENGCSVVNVFLFFCFDVY